MAAEVKNMMDINVNAVMVKPGLSISHHTSQLLSIKRAAIPNLLVYNLCETRYRLKCLRRNNSRIYC
jgi:hypothetical protein